MECPTCGKWAEADPDTGYDADGYCSERCELEGETGYRVCAECGQWFEPLRHEKTCGRVCREKRKYRLLKGVKDAKG